MADWRLNEEGVEVTGMPDRWRLLSASMQCPVCGEINVVQPIHGLCTVCRSCGESLAVIIAPMTVKEGYPPVCAFQARTKDGQWSWLVQPGFCEFGEWEEVQR